ncbi:hypothetical protein [Aliarcobacter skirrowii]|uniref:hypothetical protein n=1 Tax=Aliarcobacter skirrowii TaxID=28200 RepID=UPI00083299B9|nr:hypothetical protein [Aliarcobacter skirrowii]
MQKNLLQEWLYNFINGKDNYIHIYIEGDKPVDINIPSYPYLTFLSKDKVGFSCCGIKKITSRQDYQHLIQQQIKTNKNKTFIYIKNQEDIEKFLYILKKKDIDQHSNINYIVYKQMSFNDVISSSEEKLKNFINEREELFQAIDDNYVNFDKKELISLLHIFYGKRILIARFAQQLYRFSELDFTSSEKKIGGILHSLFSVSSKTFITKNLSNYKLIKNKKPITHIKAYDLNYNQVELDIKIKIATDLFKMNIKELDLVSVSKVTRLPFNTAESIYNKIFLK